MTKPSILTCESVPNWRFGVYGAGDPVPAILWSERDGWSVDWPRVVAIAALPVNVGRVDHIWMCRIALAVRQGGRIKANEDGYLGGEWYNVDYLAGRLAKHVAVGAYPRGYQGAAMTNLWPLPQRSRLFPVSDKQLDADERWVAEKRAWVATQADRRVREAYEGWLRFVERGIAENREENRTHAYKTESDARWQEMLREMRRGDHVATLIPSPRDRSTHERR